MKVSGLMGGRIRVDGKPLDIRPSLKVRNHSSEFNFGYGGSGPAQLALAILLAGGLDERTADARHQDFKWDVIATLPDGFEMDLTINPDGTWKVNSILTPPGQESGTGKTASPQA